mmetsp:Transcript_26973/g.62720  ORF Transcript_26973/g.62720 Transcript_26973/m.62720 type:complete len:239 (-) Transcript_26973:423-1139(-)
MLVHPPIWCARSKAAMPLRGVGGVRPKHLCCRRAVAWPDHMQVTTVPLAGVVGCHRQSAICQRTRLHWRPLGPMTCLLLSLLFEPDPASIERRLQPVGPFAAQALVAPEVVLVGLAALSGDSNHFASTRLQSDRLLHLPQGAACHHQGPGSAAIHRHSAALALLLLPRVLGVVGLPLPPPASFAHHVEHPCLLPRQRHPHLLRCSLQLVPPKLSHSRLPLRQSPVRQLLEGRLEHLRP